MASSSVNAGTVRYCQTGRVRQARREGVRVQKPAVDVGQGVDAIDGKPGGESWRSDREFHRYTCRLGERLHEDIIRNFLSDLENSTILHAPRWFATLRINFHLQQVRAIARNFMLDILHRLLRRVRSC